MRNVSRALVLAALLVTAALVAGACSTIAGPAWQVNDVSMSVDDFYAAYQKNLETGSTTTTAGDRIATASLASFMTNEIQKELLAQGLAEKGIEITQADRDSAQQVFQNQAQQSGSSATPTDEQLETQAGISALGRKLAEDGAASGIIDVEAAARQLYESNKESLITPGETCAHFILVPAGDLLNSTTAPTDEEYAAAEAEAATVLTRLATEDFATVSKEVSVIEDQLPGGDFGCHAMSEFPSEVVPIVEAAAPGVLVGPTKIEGGYLITRVDSRTDDSEPPTFEAVEAQATEAVLAQLGQRLVGEWLLDRAKTADVVVDARFGSWDAANATVVPPEGPSSPTVPTTSITGIDPSTLGGLGTTDTSVVTPAAP